MANNGSYSSDRTGAAGENADYSADPASGGFFHSDYKKHDDLKQMLDSNKDSLKLEAMKRIIGMVAKGRDASDLFPAVVKNVVSKNIEVKKLVYVYLVRYAEEQQDLALLSISTFQRALKDPNQLIRASALRVLSSIRVPMIVPIVMLAIKDSASDMSPYVRKTAAHAIPKLYSLDQEQKEELVHVIEKLLSDKTTLVVGSAVMAFEEVCPERIDLVHKNYRKLCNLLVDVDEWGQVIIINMLTRYARSQFRNPNSEDMDDDNSDDKPFYDDEDEEDDKPSKGDKSRKVSSLDPDHRLLLRNTKPLLQSRNASVVMAVSQLYHHLAPRSEVTVVAKALIRLLRSHREVQSVVLNCIASISTLRKGMFEPFLKSFFVRTSDPTHIKLLKLEILTNLATETSISVILREFQTYISSQDKEFVAAAIQAIGRCASNIKEVTDTCLSGLVALLSNRDEAVVAESVVVIKKLLQTQPSEHKDIIIHMAKLVDYITVPQARASILWLLGEYSDRVPKIAPDVLRKMAKCFITEEDIVKLQILNLAVKLFLTNPKQTKLLCQYVFSLARYDQNYDIRDRARFLRQFIFPSCGMENSYLAKHAKKIFLATKPAPVLKSKFKDREQFQLGSLSHYINARAMGYHDLPLFPEVVPDSSVRDVEMPAPVTEPRSKKTQVKKRSFYSSESEHSSAAEDSDEDSSDEDDDDEDGSDSSEESSEEESEEDSDSENETEEEGKNNKVIVMNNKMILLKDAKSKPDGESSVEDSASSEDSDGTSEDGSGEESSESFSQNKKKQPVKYKSETPQAKSNLDLLLELDEVPPTITPVMTPSFGGFLTPATPVNSSMPMSIQVTSASYVPLTVKELVNKISGRGLSVSSRFTRSTHLFSPTMVSIELTFTNHSSQDITDIRTGNKELGPEMVMHDFAPISCLPVNASLPGVIGIDFRDSTQPVSFHIVMGDDERSCKVTLKAPVGELLQAVTMPEAIFTTEQSKLRGMNEHSCVISLTPACKNQKTICQRVYEIANVASVPSSDPLSLRFAGQSLSSKSLVLVTIKLPEETTTNQASIVVNCEKMVIASMLLNEIKSHLRS